MSGKYHPHTHHQWHMCIYIHIYICVDIHAYMHIYCEFDFDVWRWTGRRQKSNGRENRPAPGRLFFSKHPVFHFAPMFHFAPTIDYLSIYMYVDIYIYIYIYTSISPLIFTFTSLTEIWLFLPVVICCIWTNSSAYFCHMSVTFIKQKYDSSNRSSCGTSRGQTNVSQTLGALRFQNH